VSVTPEAPTSRRLAEAHAWTFHATDAEDLREGARSLSNLEEGAPIAHVLAGTPIFQSTSSPPEAAPQMRAPRHRHALSTADRAKLDGKLRQRGWEEKLAPPRVTMVGRNLRLCQSAHEARVGGDMTKPGK